MNCQNMRTQQNLYFAAPSLFLKSLKSMGKVIRRNYTFFITVFLYEKVIIQKPKIKGMQVFILLCGF